MAKLVHEYETIIIIRPDLDDPTTYGLVERLEGVLESQEAILLIRDDWGKRKLAYPIKKHIKGHYVRLNYLSSPAVVAELERNIRILDSIVRFLTVQLDEHVDVAVRTEQAAEQRRQAEEKARLEAERAAAEAAAEAERLAAAAAAKTEGEAEGAPA